MSTDVFGALASPVRREILNLLLLGPAPVNEIAARFDMRRPSVSEHLRVLREAGLVTERRDGRQRHYELRPAPLHDVRDWLKPYEHFWRGKLRDLRGLLDNDPSDPDLPDPDPSEPEPPEPDPSEPDPRADDPWRESQ